jgi:GH24 family phage-related lysozyme (muramidase)
MSEHKPSAFNWNLPFYLALAVVITALVMVIILGRPAAVPAPIATLPPPTNTPLVISTAAPTPTPTPGLPAAVSEKGRSFIAALEGMYLKAYEDAGGYCTIGIGHRVDQSYCNNGMSISTTRAFQWFDEDLIRTQAFLVSELGSVELNQCQYDAVASFEFNVGPYTFRQSGISIQIRLGNYLEVPDLLRKFIYAGGGNPNSGLQTRREAESKLFEECVYAQG